MIRVGNLAFCLSGFLAGCSDQAAVPVAVVTSQLAVEATLLSIDPAKLDAAKASIRNEPKVIDFVYDPEASVEWTIGVKDDGSPRLGFAEYFCLRLGELGVRTDRTAVRIVDYRKYMAPGGNGQDASLGAVECSSGEPFPG